MTRGLLVGVLLLAAGGSTWLNWSFWRPPARSEPMAIAAGPGRAVLDLLRAPTTVSATCAGQPVALPGTPGRYLVAELREGSVVVGWSGDPAVGPDVVATVAEHCTTFVAYVDRQRPGTAVIEGWRGWTRATGVRALDLRFR